MSFRYNDEVIVKKGLFAGMRGRVINRDSCFLVPMYTVKIETGQWEHLTTFFPWQIRKVIQDTKVKEMTIWRVDFRRKRKVGKGF